MDYLIEIIGLLYCIHCWYEKKISINIRVVAVICVDVLICGLINEYNLTKLTIIIVYYSLILYCFSQFEVPLMEHFVSLIMAFIFMSFCQLLAFLPTIFIHNEAEVDYVSSLFYNLVSLGLTIVSKRKIAFGKIKKYIMDHNWLTNILFTIFVSGIIFSLIQYRFEHGISVVGYICIVFFCGIMCVVWYAWMKEKEKTLEKELDLKICKLYYKSFEELLQLIRERQHDFKNHLQTIYNYHHLCNSFEELVEMQQEYCNELIWNNKYSGLLSCGNAVLAGFLYGKFIEAEQQQIDIEYEVIIKKKDLSIPYFVIVETIGILLDNAIEALSGLVEKRISIKIIETESELQIDVKNEVGEITINEFMKFFENDRSTKGAYRGIGLVKIKKYSKLYNWKIVVDIFENLGKRYLQISIFLK